MGRQKRRSQMPEMRREGTWVSLKNSKSQNSYNKMPSCFWCFGFISMFHTYRIPLCGTVSTSGLAFTSHSSLLSQNDNRSSQSPVSLPTDAYLPLCIYTVHRNVMHSLKSQLPTVSSMCNIPFSREHGLYIHISSYVSMWIICWMAPTKLADIFIFLFFFLIR